MQGIIHQSHNSQARPLAHVLVGEAQAGHQILQLAAWLQAARSTHTWCPSSPVALSWLALQEIKVHEHWEALFGSVDGDPAHSSLSMTMRMRQLFASSAPPRGCALWGHAREDLSVPRTT